MKFRVVLTLVLMFMYSALMAQDKIFITATVGQYSMRSMKNFQEELRLQIASSGINVKPVATFPASLQVDAGYKKTLRQDMQVGIYVNYAVTKGRLHYSDYSGETYADQDVSRIVLGGSFAKAFDHGFALYGKLGLNYSMLDLNFFTEIFGAGSDSQLLKFSSIGINVEPGLSWSIPIGKFDFGVHAGYEINIQGQTNYKEKDDAYLLDEDGGKVIINWSGLRAGIGVSFTL